MLLNAKCNVFRLANFSLSGALNGEEAWLRYQRWRESADINELVLILGVFKTGVGKPNENNTNRTIDLVCTNGANDAPPFWNPPYDHDINPFPECVFLRKYSSKLIST